MSTKRIYGSPDPSKPPSIVPRLQTFSSHISADSRREMAYYHTLGRTVRVQKLLSSLSVMTSAARHGGEVAPRISGLRGGPSVRCTGAKLQEYSVEAPNAAAHYLPGQVRFNGLPLWEYVRHPGSQIFVKSLFSDVDKLHYLFNISDLASERGPEGLKELLAQCCYIVVQDPAPPSGNRANRQLVANVLERLWVPGSSRAFGAAIEVKEEKPQMPPLKMEWDPVQGNVITNLKERSEAGSYEMNIEDTVKILKDYQESAAAQPTPAQTADSFEEVDAKVQPT
jgi:hypothetical protein